MERTETDCIHGRSIVLHAEVFFIVSDSVMELFSKVFPTSADIVIAK